MRRRNPLLLTAAALAAALVPLSPVHPAGAAPARTAAAPHGAAAGKLQDPTSAAGRTDALPRSWRSSDDVAWTLRGDSTGLHLLLARQDEAYAWRTVASLSEPGFDTDQWIGNACLTQSGRRAVVVYAPRGFVNGGATFNRGGFVAVVDTVTGDVKRLPVHASLAYYSPGCGTGERAVLTQQRSPEDSTSRETSTRLIEVDAAHATLATPVEVPGQVTSAVPTRAGIVAAAGHGLVAYRDGRHRVVTLSRSTPAYVSTDAAGDVVYVEGTEQHNAVMRVPAAGRRVRAQVVAESRGAWLELARGTRGRTFVVGTKVTPRSLGSSRVVVADPGDEVSTAAAAVIEAAPTPVPTTAPDSALHRLLATPATPADEPEPLHLDLRVVSNGRHLPFTVTPGVRAVAGSDSEVAPVARGGTASRSARVSAATAVSGTGEPGATCAIARNDATSQVYQPSPRQVEWAADRAVLGTLTTARPANWKQSGLPSWSPQGMFPPVPLAGGGGQMPPQILLGILMQESNLWQATSHAKPGETGNPLVGNYYGRDIYNDDEADDWDIDFAGADCGYGVGQLTDGMRKAGSERPGEVALPAQKQRAVALDYATNVAASLRLLQQKWNETYNAGVRHDNADPQWLENWFFATWAYNSGFHPQSEAGANNGAWGVGWLNNPANPNYPPVRQMFRLSSTDAVHPNDWSYPERVIGWAAWSIEKPGETPSGMGPAIASWVTDQQRRAAEPSPSAFCDSSNECQPGAQYQPTDPAVSGEPAGPCAHRSAAGQYDLKCWYHATTTYKNCDDEYDPAVGAVVQPCGHGSFRYVTAAEPALKYTEGGTSYDFDFYEPVCTTAGLPSGALVVDDVPASVKSPRDGCGHPWTEAGSFALSFADPAGRIDFHQLGSGFGGHFWFAHTRTAAASGGRLQVTGTWSFANALTSWGRVLVHMPDNGAHTQQAAYRIGLGDGTVKTRYALQRTRADEWVSLGVMKFNGKPSIKLGSDTWDGWGGDDIAFDAVAIQPLAAKPRNFVVALGDSYSSGEGASSTDGADYYEETDVLGDVADDRGRNACHRSKLAWSRKAVLKDSTATLGARADSWDNQLDYQLHACSGATTENILPFHSVPAGQTPPTNLFGKTGTGQYGEVSQMDKGYLDANTTLVTLSIGGNDARFSDVIKECIYAAGLQACPDTELSGESEDMDVTVPRDINGRVRRSIEVTVEEIAKRAPNAKIVLMGYPKLLENSGQCVPGIGTAEAPWINDMGQVMSDMLQNLVGTSTYGLQAAGYKVWYANPIAQFAGQGICGNPETIHGIVTDRTEGDKPGVLNFASNQSFHPKPAGTDHYRDALQATLRLPAVALGP